METKSQLNQFFVVLYFIGIGLLIAGFLILVPDAQQTHTAWLDLVVVCLVYSANFPMLYLGRWRSRGFDTQIPALGLLAVCDLFYSVLALGGIVVGWFIGLHFRTQLVGQVSLFFAGVIAVSMARYSSAHADEVAEEEYTTRTALENLRKSLELCEAAMRLRTQPVNRELQLLLALKDDARYLSPSVSEAALSYEQKIVAEVEGIHELVASGAALHPGALDERFQQCAVFMALRKKILN